MPIFCASYLPFLFVFAAVALCLIMILRQQLRFRHKQNIGFDRQSEWLLLAMLAAALLGTALFVIFIFSPPTGC